MASTVPRVSIGAIAIVAIFFGIVLPAVNAQAPAPAPTSDGHVAHVWFRRNYSMLLEYNATWCSNHSRTSIDQGIAYVLMLVALILTYLIHPLDASSPYKLF